jgi:hypothetical protein
MQNKRLAVFIIFLILVVLSVEAQKQVNSPYSRFNLGTLNRLGSFRSLAMGGTGIAMRDNNSMYFTNPASYTSIDTISFIFDFGADMSAYYLNDGTNTFNSLDINFDHLIIGMPLWKKFGLVAGLVPVTNGYYYMSETIGSSDTANYDPISGEASTVHKGTGGLGKFFVGSGFKITKNLSVGANMNILLGELNRLNQYEFSDYTSTFNQRGTEKLRIHGISLDFGIQYAANLKNDYFLIAGFSMNRERKYRSTVERLNERFSVYSMAPYSPDTLSYYKNSSKDSTIFPASYKFGLTFGKKDKFAAEFDYSYTPWSHGMIHGDNTYLADVQALSFGLEYIPERFSNTSFLKRVEYRLGAHYADNYLILKGVQLKEYGASLGLGIRLRSTRSKANFYFDYTRKMGDIDAGLHNEGIYSFGISLNLYDNWFMKKKYE